MFVFLRHIYTSLTMEELLHYVWKHKLFPLGEQITDDGKPLEIIDPGLPNRNAGPDFFNAKVKLNGVLWVGNVELHTASSDWTVHGHQSDPAYDSVVLHVVERIDTDVYRHNGEKVPQWQLSCPSWVEKHYQELRASDIFPPCYTVLRSLSKLTIHSWLSALQTERFEEKTQQIGSRLERLGQNWEQAFFITLARYFGFGLNGDAFETWAWNLCFRAVDKYRDNPFQVEAIFLGQAGLLNEEQGDDYYLRLRKEFLYLQHMFGLKVMDVSLWRFLRTRPGNFPYVRLAQLAHLYSVSAGLFSQLMEADSLKKVRLLLSTSTSDYWETHYVFGKKNLGRKSKLLSESSLNVLIINAVIPFLYAYGLHQSKEELCQRASDFLEELKAENNYVTRLFEGAGVVARSAADSQALLQLKKGYCDPKKCLYCRFGYEYLKSR